MYNTKWIFCPQEQPDAKVRLFCFPYAGGGTSVFVNWAANILAEIELCLIKMPGRESRFNEEPYRRLPNMINDLIPPLLPFLDKPFLFFGHSLGAHISFYLARYLRKNKLQCPDHLFVSGARAPHLPEHPDIIHYEMADKTFIKKLNELGGMAGEVLQNQDLVDLVLPILRADIEMLNTIRYTEEKPLDCSITSLGGISDKRVSRDDAEAWNKHTSNEFDLKMIPGKHLFMNSHQNQVINIINQEVKMFLYKYE